MEKTSGGSDILMLPVLTVLFLRFGEQQENTQVPLDF